MSCRSGAEWDADRKNCVVTDWQKYDESLKEEKDEDEDDEEEGEEEEPNEAIDEDEAKAAKLNAKLEELKTKLGGGGGDEPVIENESHDEL